ncbi:MAG: YicC family protein [Acidimicrobiaceae bacterium]|nr:YicC family protein [Acidimicrobiaceae bacterium]
MSELGMRRRFRCGRKTRGSARYGQENMIKSMTGFSSVSREHELATLSVTVRSVNHRHLDIQMRLPQMLTEQENSLRSLIRDWVARGRVELAVTVRENRLGEPQVMVNEALVGALSAAVARAEEQGLTTGGLSSSDLLRFPHAVVVQEHALDDGTRDVIQGVATEAAKEALRGLDEMRTREGEYLCEDLGGKLAIVSRLVEELAEAAVAGQQDFGERLRRRVAEIRDHVDADESLVAQELVRFASRSDVNEEIVRLRGHIGHWSVLVDGPEPCGRKLDFLLQEMNREVNTLGAKISGTEIGERIVAAKAELERLREQVQNVE